MAEEKNPKVQSQMEYSCYADPLTITNNENIRIWVQPRIEYSFRIAKVSMDSYKGLVREKPVFEERVPTVTSSDSRRGIWNAYAEIPSSFCKDDGLYVIDIGPETILPTLNTSIASAFFIVRRNCSGNILYKFPTNTWNAYSRMPWEKFDQETKMCSFYECREKLEPIVPYNRPGIGINYAKDPEAYLREQIITHVFANCLLEGHIEFLQWLTVNKVKFDLCTDIDLQTLDYKVLLEKYRLLICSGHEEYWSEEMRNKVAAHINHGRNVAFLSGNNLAWKIDFKETRGTDPDSNLLELLAFKKEFRISGWASPDSKLTGMSRFGKGGDSSNADGHRPDFPYKIDSDNIESWFFYGMGESPSLPENDSYLFYYEFDNIDNSTPSDFIVVAKNEKTISGQSGIDETNGHLDATPPIPYPQLNTAIGYFQPFGGVVNVGTTEWIKKVSVDIKGKEASTSVQQITKNIIQVLTTDREFISVGRFSRSKGFDILYSNQIAFPKETKQASIVSYWALDRTQLSATVERGKWLSSRQDKDGFSAKAFGIDKNGNSNLYFQSGNGDIEIWHVIFNYENATNCVPFVKNKYTIGSEKSKSLNMIGAGSVTNNVYLDLIFFSNSGITIWFMESEMNIKIRGEVTLPFPSDVNTFCAFGSVPFNKNHVPAIAMYENEGSKHLIIYRITENGLVKTNDMMINNLSAGNKIFGFSDLNNDGKVELAISDKNFFVKISKPLQNQGLIDLSQNELTQLEMRPGFLHDS